MTGNRGSSVESQICCWPTCSTGVTGFPMCWHHAFDAYSMVNSNLQAMFALNLNAVETREKQGYVYFLRFRDRIKIGFSTCLVSRFEAIPHEEILGYVPGTMRDEKRCHAAFAHLRENGEWFRIEPDLLEFIASVDMQHTLKLKVA